MLTYTSPWGRVLSSCRTASQYQVCIYGCIILLRGGHSSGKMRGTASITNSSYDCDCPPPPSPTINGVLLLLCVDCFHDSCVSGLICLVDGKPVGRGVLWMNLWKDAMQVGQYVSGAVSSFGWLYSSTFSLRLSCMVSFSLRHVHCVWYETNISVITFCVPGTTVMCTLIP